MDPLYKLVIIFIAFCLAALSFVFVALPLFGTLPVPSLSSVAEIVVLFALLLIVSATAVFLLYRKAVIRHPGTENKMVLRKRLDFK
jgi:hypothetical protein